MKICGRLIPTTPAVGGMNSSLWREKTAQSLAGFVESVVRMVRRGGHIPDLAGVGNLMITPGGRVVLVDINNVSPVVFDDKIRLDDKGYPVTDRSVEALYLLETRLLGREKAKNRSLYRTFLTSGRMAAVLKLAAGFPAYARNP